MNERKTKKKIYNIIYFLIDGNIRKNTSCVIYWGKKKKKKTNWWKKCIEIRCTFEKKVNFVYTMGSPLALFS